MNYFTLGYGVFDPQAHIEAIKKFDVMIIGAEMLDKVAEIKEIHPTIKLIVYNSIISSHPNYSDWGEVETHEDWFLHDINGERLQVGSWYAMDIANRQWRTHLIQRCLSWIQNHDVDGIFTDNTWTFWRNKWSIFTVSDDLVADLPNWHNDMITFLSEFKTALGTKLLIPNTVDPQNYIGVCDGQFFELVFVRPLHDIPMEINLLKNASKNGKYFFCFPTMGSHVYEEFAFHCFLLGAESEKALFGIGKVTDGSNGFRDFMTVNTGRAIGSFYVEDGILKRTFEHVKVTVDIANMTSSLIMEETPYPSIGDNRFLLLLLICVLMFAIVLIPSLPKLET